MTRVQHAAVRQGVQTAADVAFSGESLGEALKHNAPMVMIDAVQGYVAQRIGEWHHGTEEEFIAAQDKRLEQSNGDIESIIFTAQETSLLDSVTHKLMHSALGAGIAAIKHEDIAAGAVAAPLGEMISETYGKYQKSQIQQDFKDGKISVREVSERLSNAKVSAVEVAKVGTAVAALFTGRDVNTATNAAGNAAENNFVPVLVAGAVIAMQIATAIDVATNCYEFKVAMDKGDVDGAIAAGVAVGMAAVPGQKLIPAPLRKAVHGVVTKSVTRILHSKYGQAAVKAGGAVVDAASSKVQNLASKAANSKAGQFVQKKIGDSAVKQAENGALHQLEKNTLAEPIDLRVKPKVNKSPLSQEELDMMGPYSKVKGHHVHSKKAFEGHVNYDPKKGFSMSNQSMKSLGVDHNDITVAQRRLFTELAKSGRPNTLNEHTRIAVQSLVEVGVPIDKARSIAARGLLDLRAQGVRTPVNIPWNNKVK